MKAALFFPDAFTAWNFHKKLLLSLRSHFDVYVISAPQYPKHVHAISEAGIHFIPIKLHRFINPLADVAAMAHLYAIFRTHRFASVHSFNLKCFIYGSTIAYIARVPKIFGTIEGLGFTYAPSTSLRGRVLRSLMDTLNRVACVYADKVWFVNEEDRDIFISSDIISAAKTVVIRGSGISVEEFSEEALNSERLTSLKSELSWSEADFVTTMVSARAIWSKGIRQFVDAARIIAGRNNAAKFVLVAPIEANSPDSVPIEYLRDAERTIPGLVWLSTFRSDVREIVALSSVFVLPSFYREGLPKVLLEAMALGKPIVTTDNVGCRLAVEDGHNGFVVPVRDPVALVDAIEILAGDEQLRARFGRASRTKVERELADDIVLPRVFREVYGLEEGVPVPS